MWFCALGGLPKVGKFFFFPFCVFINGTKFLLINLKQALFFSELRTIQSHFGHTSMHAHTHSKGGLKSVRLT